MRSDALSSIRSSLERLTPFGQGSSGRVLELGIPALDAALPQRGLPYGSVTELQVQGTSGAATSFALCACRAAQQRFFRQQPFRQQSRQQASWASPRGSTRGTTLGTTCGATSGIQPRSPWCAFIDPTVTLFAPGVARLGVDLGHLLVARPDFEAVSRVAIRIAEANFVSVLVIDLTGPIPHGCAKGSISLERSALERSALKTRQPSVDEHSWQRTVRRLALAVRSAPTIVLLITRAEQFQSLPLPTFMRLELARRSTESFELRVAKDRTGRISTTQSIAHSVFEPNALFLEQGQGFLEQGFLEQGFLEHGLQGNSLEPVVAERQVS